MRSIRELPEDVLCEKLIDFPVPRHGLRNACPGVVIPIVISAMPDQYASGFVELADQIGPFQAMVNSATLRTPDISPLDKSLCRSLRFS